MMLAKFRDHYPQGSLVSKLVQIDRGNFIVKVSIKVENVTLVTALAGASNVEAAEDAARTRAIAALCLDRQTTPPVSAPKSPKHIALVEPQQTPAETLITPERKDFSATNKVVKLAEAETINPSPANLASGNGSSNSSHPPSQPQVLEPEIASTRSARSAQDSSNLFEGTFTPPANLSPSEDHKSRPNQVATETNTVNFEFAAEPISNATTDNPPVKVTEISADFDFTQVKQKTDIEIARLGWTRDDGREFLQSRYGKRSRLHLKDEELQEFLGYLEQLPTPVN